MKYTLNINQKEIVEQKHDIDIIDAAILETIFNMEGSRGIVKVIHENTDFYWMSHKKLCDELPILKMKPDTMYRRIKSLVKKKYIEPHPENKKLRTTYYRTTVLTESLFSNIGKKSDTSENNPKHIGKKSVRVSDENPKDNNTINNTTNKNNGKKILPKFSFDSFWNKYNYKKNKQQALKAWKKLKDEDKEKALKAVDGYLTYLQAKNHPQCHASTWLNNRRFEDDNNLSPTIAPEQENPTEDKLSDNLEKAYIQRAESLTAKTGGRIKYFTRAQFVSWLKGGSNYEKYRDRGYLGRNITSKIVQTINYLSNNTFTQKLTGNLNDFVQDAFDGKIREIT